MDLPTKVKRIIVREDLIEKGDRVLLAISGGIDSVALFHILREISKEIPFDYALAHLNHCLRGEESERDENFVRNLSQKFGVPLFVERANVKEYMRVHGLSLQHAARNLRYSFLFSTAEKNNYNKIAVAHTLDDQVETFFLRVIKGTGVRGISSIPIRRGPIIRPLLFTKRDEIEAYCKEKGIEYVEDSSNEKTTYQRNYLRKMVIPLLYRINPKFKEKLANLFSDLTLLNRFFDEKAKRFIEEEVKVVDSSYVLDVNGLKDLDGETRFRVISEIAAKINPGFIVQRNHVKLIERIVFSNKPSLSVKLPGSIVAERSYGELHLRREEKHDVLVDLNLELKEGINRLDPFGLNVEVKVMPKPSDFNPRTESKTVAFLDGDKVGTIRVRTFREGDRFVPLGLKSPVKLKDFFIKNKIPKPRRRKIPIFVSGDDIVWVFGLRIDERYKVKEDTKVLLKLEVSYQDNKDRGIM